MQVAPGVWRITTPLPFRPRTVHAYLIAASPDTWILADGGADTDEAWAALEEGVRTIAGGWDAVEAHLVTHMHVDHIGLARRVHAATRAPLAMGALDAERARHASLHPDEEARYRSRLLARCGAPASLAGGGAPPALASPPGAYLEPHHLLACEPAPSPYRSGWLAVWTPGHTAGHMSLLRERDGVLIAGDAVLSSITPTIGVNRQRPDPVADYLDALTRLREIRPTLVLAGHGDPIPNPDARLLELRDATARESQRVRSLLSAEPATAWAVTRARYAGRELASAAWMQALRETLAHLEHLVQTGAARSEPGDLVRFWLD